MARWKEDERRDAPCVAVGKQLCSTRNVRASTSFPSLFSGIIEDEREESRFRFLWPVIKPLLRGCPRWTLDFRSTHRWGKVAPWEYFARTRSTTVLFSANNRAQSGSRACSRFLVPPARKTTVDEYIYTCFSVVEQASRWLTSFQTLRGTLKSLRGSFFFFFFGDAALACILETPESVRGRGVW